MIKTIEPLIQTMISSPCKLFHYAFTAKRERSGGTVQHLNRCYFNRLIQYESSCTVLYAATGPLQQAGYFLKCGSRLLLYLLWCFSPNYNYSTYKIPTVISLPREGVEVEKEKNGSSSDLVWRSEVLKKKNGKKRIIYVRIFGKKCKVIKKVSKVGS